MFNIVHRGKWYIGGFGSRAGKLVVTHVADAETDFSETIAKPHIGLNKVKVKNDENQIIERQHVIYIPNNKELLEFHDFFEAILSKNGK